MLEVGQIDRQKDAPPYEQIAQILRHAITSRQLAPGERLPTEGKLAEQFGVARMTVRRAVQELRNEGLLVPASGRGLAVKAVPAIREPWPQEPGHPAEATMPNFNLWGDVAPLIAQAENIRTRMYVLSGDLHTEVGSLAGDPAVAATLLGTLAGIGLAEADVLGALATRLHLRIPDLDQANDLAGAVKAAGQAFTEACGAAQSAADTIRRYVLENADLSTAKTREPSSPADDQRDQR